jgi:anti-sigma factor RsiW
LSCLEEHLRDCSACRALAAEIKETTDRFEQARNQSPVLRDPEGLVEQIARALPRAPRLRTRRWEKGLLFLASPRFSLLASGLLVLLAGLFAFQAFQVLGEVSRLEKRMAERGETAALNSGTAPSLEWARRCAAVLARVEERGAGEEPLMLDRQTLADLLHEARQLSAADFARLQGILAGHARSGMGRWPSFRSQLLQEWRRSLDHKTNAL